MDRSAPSMLDHAISRMTDAFGDPLCRGDCCWWTLSREGRMPVRLSMFLDSDEETPQGWLCDLETPHTSIERFTLTSESQVAALVERVQRLVVENTGVQAASSG
jgi:hypothetical protein